MRISHFSIFMRVSISHCNNSRKFILSPNFNFFNKCKITILIVYLIYKPSTLTFIKHLFVNSSKNTYLAFFFSYCKNFTYIQNSFENLLKKLSIKCIRYNLSNKIYLKLNFLSHKYLSKFLNSTHITYRNIKNKRKYIR